MSYNHNIRARPKKTEEKESAYEKHDRLVLTALSFTKENGIVSESSIRTALKLSPTKLYQVMSDLIHNYQDIVSWNKKTRMLTHISVSPYQQEIKDIEKTLKEKPGLYNEEQNVIRTIKQEAHK